MQKKAYPQLPEVVVLCKGPHFDGISQRNQQKLAKWSPTEAHSSAPELAVCYKHTRTSIGGVTNWICTMRHQVRLNTQSPRCKMQANFQITGTKGFQFLFIGGAHCGPAAGQWLVDQLCGSQKNEVRHLLEVLKQDVRWTFTLLLVEAAFSAILGHFWGISGFGYFAKFWCFWFDGFLPNGCPKIATISSKSRKIGIFHTKLDKSHNERKFLPKFGKM